MASDHSGSIEGAACAEIVHCCGGGRPPLVQRSSVPELWPASVTFSLPPLSIRDEIARRLRLPSKLMAQHNFRTCRRICSVRAPAFPSPCHVDQDVAYRAWRALGHLTTFDRVLSPLRRRNHLPVPPPLRPADVPWAPRAPNDADHTYVHLDPIVTFAPQPSCALARPLCRPDRRLIPLAALNMASQ